jgi:Cu2+-containing amine oxidase
MYEGSLGGMIVPYGDPDVGWYFKAYLTPATTAWAP